MAYNRPAGPRYQDRGPRRDDRRGFGDRGPDRGADRGPGGDFEGGRDGFRQRRGIPLSDLDPTLTDISRRVIGCAIEVHMELGPGFEDHIYREALLIELAKAGIKSKRGHAIPVYYDDKKIGETLADMLIEDRFILGVMARPGDVHIGDRRTIMAQLRELDLDLGLIINFGERRLKDGLVRVLNVDKLRALKDGAAGSDEDGAEAEEVGEHVSDEQA